LPAFGWNHVHRELPFTARFELRDLSDIESHQVEADASDEGFVVIQGIVDVAIITDREIKILDYKTDEIDQEALSGRLDKYRIQLELYARALERIYRRPVTQKWLHFLALNQSVSLT